MTLRSTMKSGRPETRHGHHKRDHRRSHNDTMRDVTDSLGFTGHEAAQAPPPRKIGPKRRRDWAQSEGPLAVAQRRQQRSFGGSFPQPGHAQVRRMEKQQMVAPKLRGQSSATVQDKMVPRPAAAKTPSAVDLTVDDTSPDFYVDNNKRESWGGGSTMSAPVPRKTRRRSATRHGLVDTDDDEEQEPPLQEKEEDDEHFHPCGLDEDRAQNVRQVVNDITNDRPNASTSSTTLSPVQATLSDLWSRAKGVFSLSKVNSKPAATRTSTGSASTTARPAGRPKRKRQAIVPGQAIVGHVAAAAREDDDDEYFPRRTLRAKQQKKQAAAAATTLNDSWEEVEASRAKRKVSAATASQYRRENGRRSSAARRRKKEPEHIDLVGDDSDEEEEDDMMVDAKPSPVPQIREFDYDACRIALGKKVIHTNCKLTMSSEGKLRLSGRGGGGARKTRSGKTGTAPTDWNLDIAMDDVQEMLFYEAQASDEDVADFLSIRAHANERNGLDKLTKSYNEEAAVESGQRFLVVEFHERNQLEKLRNDMKQGEWMSFEDMQVLGTSEAKKYAKVLIDESKGYDQRRKKHATPVWDKEDPFLKDRKEDDVLLVFPFGGDKEQIDSASAGLVELGASSLGAVDLDQKPAADDDSTSADEEEGEKKQWRAHYLTVRVSDYERLNDTEFLNDTLIDLWVQWISRHNERTDVHFFSSHFYTALEEEGVASVTKWTMNKNIDIFTKKLVFIPINKALHWSLAVVVNPGAVADVDSDCCPCILFFDSLRAHGKVKIEKNIHKWLNSEWGRLEKSTETKKFTKATLPIVAPKVPLQDNGYDCGVFVCRYAFAIYQMRGRSFSLEEMAMDGSIDLTSFITQNDLFDFDMKDIDRIRLDFKGLIQRLSKLYIPWKEAEDRKERNAKLARKKARAELVGATAEEASKIFIVQVASQDSSGVEVVDPVSSVVNEMAVVHDDLAHPATNTANPSDGTEGFEGTRESANPDNADNDMTMVEVFDVKHPGDPRFRGVGGPCKFLRLGVSTLSPPLAVEKDVSHEYEQQLDGEDSLCPDADGTMGCHGQVEEQSKSPSSRAGHVMSTLGSNPHASVLWESSDDEEGDTNKPMDESLEETVTPMEVEVLGGETVEKPMNADELQPDSMIEPADETEAVETAVL